MLDKAEEIVKSGVAIVGAIVALSLWGARLEFQVGERAKREEVIALQHELTQMHRELRAMRRMMCANGSKDSICGEP